MALVAICPKCAAQLALPRDFVAGSRGQCPKCAAEFSLDEPTQVVLPMVRILEAPPTAAEPPSLAELSPVAGETPTSDETAVDQPDFGTGILDEAETRKTLADWEERLKKAINAGTSIESDSSEPLAATPTDETLANEATASGPTDGSTNGPTDLDFEVELDPPPVAEEAQAPDGGDNSAQPDATVNDFSDDPVEQYSPVAGEGTEESTVRELESDLPFEPAPMLDRGEPTAADFAMPVEENPPSLVLDTSRLRPAKRRVLPKLVAMLLFGPLLGGLLGLYGLLWIEGPGADFLGLAKYLPPALLPPAMLTASAASPESPPVRTDPDVQPAMAQHEVADPRAPEGIPLGEFVPLVAAAKMAVPDLITGDLHTRESRARKGQAYMVLSRLAEEFKFVSQHADDPAALEEITAAKETYRQVTASGSTLADLAQIAILWWEHPGRSNSGIFFAGRIRAARPIGAGTLCQIVLDQQFEQRPITVLFPRMKYELGDPVGVVGAVVTEPQSEIPGYDSSETQVVVAYDSYAL